MNNNKLGDYGENLAESFLKKNGYKIIERNFRIRGGELDIIALDKDTLVYVEVKTRSNNRFGLPEESVTNSKINFIKKAALFYKSQRKNIPDLERIDVVSIDLSQKKPIISLIKNVTF